MKRIIGLFIVFILAFPLASIAAEPAWWTQMKNACINSGGRPVSNYYNDWVAGGGCVCPGSTKGSGQPTCSGGSSSSGGAGTGSNGDLITKSTEGVVQGIMSGDANLTGIGIMGVGVGMFLQGAQGDPAAAARQKAEEQARAAQAAEERRRQEEETLKRHEEMKNRLLGGMLNVGDSSQLGLMGADSGSGLSLMTDDRGAFVGKELKLIMGDEVTGARKLSEDEEKDSDRARKGFDTAGKIMKSDLPAAPPTPMGKPVSPIKLEKINVLKTALKKNEDEEKALKAQLEKLKQSPSPDETAMKELQNKITAKEDEKKKIEKEMEDLTAEDPDEPASNQSSTNTSTGVSQ